MPRPRFENAPAERREAVLDAATKEFAAHGYDDASINRILLAAGLSKGSFYYYFDDKPDLAGAVLEREATRYLERLADIRMPNSAAEFWAELERMMEIGKAQLRETPHVTSDAMMRLGSAMSRHPELMQRLSSNVVVQMTAKLTAFAKRGQEVGAVRTDLPIPTLIVLMQEVKIALVRVLLPFDRPPSDAEYQEFLRVHLDMIRRVMEHRPEDPKVERPPPARAKPKRSS